MIRLLRPCQKRNRRESRGSEGGNEKFASIHSGTAERIGSRWLEFCIHGAFSPGQPSCDDSEGRRDRNGTESDRPTVCFFNKPTHEPWGRRRK